MKFVVYRDVIVLFSIFKNYSSDIFMEQANRILRLYQYPKLLLIEHHFPDVNGITGRFDIVRTDNTGTLLNTH